MVQIGKILFYYLVFPGFLTLTSIALVFSWLDRKITARLQWRKGPPFFQPYYDLKKLFQKEIIIPENSPSPILFLLSPLLALISVSLAGTILAVSVVFPSQSLVGDIIVFLYFLVLPQVLVIVGALASVNPYASIGASRELKLILSYELPFLIIILGRLLSARSLNIATLLVSPPAGFISQILFILVGIIVVAAKSGIVPFDIAEAETELAGGIFIEYSGPLLALFKLSRMIMTIILILFTSTVIWPGNGLFAVIGKFLLISIILIIIRNTNPRLRIDQIMRFFWFTVSGLAILGFLLALKGL